MLCTRVYPLFTREVRRKGRNILHEAAREKLSEVLYRLGKQHQIPAWLVSAEYFVKSGKLIAQMNEQIVSNLCHESDRLGDTSQLIRQMTDGEEVAFSKMLEGANS